METDWNTLTPAPYYDLYMGFYLVENVHFTNGDGGFTGENGVPYFAEDEYDDLENPGWDMDFWNDVEPPPLTNDFMRMWG